MSSSLRYIVTISSSRYQHMSTGNATNATLGEALESGEPLIQTSATLGVTNLTYREPVSGGGILVNCPGGWWFCSTGLGLEYYAVKDHTNDVRTTIHNTATRSMLHALIRDFKRHNPQPSSAIQEIGDAVVGAIKAATAPVMAPMEDLVQKMVSERVAAIMQQQQLVVAQPPPAPPAQEPQVVAALVPRPPPPPTHPQQPPSGRMGWAEVSISITLILAVCFISYLVITKPPPPPPPAPVATTALAALPYAAANYRYPRYEEEDPDRYDDRRASFSRRAVATVSKEEVRTTAVEQQPPSETTTYSWWKLAAFTLACVFICNCFAGAASSDAPAATNDDYHYYEPRLVEEDHRHHYYGYNEE
jgi:hypothetical protein